MKAALVEQTARSALFKVPLWMPIYLPLLAAVLRRASHTVIILEPLAAGPQPPPEQLAADLLRFHPDLVLFDVRMEAWGTFRACIRAARAALPGALLLAGGRHATLCPQELLRFTPELDAVLMGEAEAALAALAGGAVPAQVPAVVTRAGAPGPVNTQPPLADLDQLPLPAWDLLDMAYYTQRTPRVIPCVPLRTATLQSSRGCASRCLFCAEGRQHAAPHRFHSAGYVADAVEKLVREHGLDGLYFSDENFLADPPRVAQLCEEFLRRGLAQRIRWSAQVRADGVAPEQLGLMRRAGCIQLEFGLESGSARLLAALGKRVSVEQNRAALRLTREAGLRSLAYVMVGLPGETAGELRETLRFLVAANPDIVRLNPYLLLPGTPLVQQLVAAGRLAPDFWREAVEVPSALDSAATNVSAMPLRELRRLARQLDRRVVLPRLARDYVAHNRLRQVPRQVHGRALLPWLLRKARP